MVSETKQSKRKLEHWMGVSVLLAVYDVVAANISYLFALLLRFDFVYSNIPQRYIEAYLHFAPIYSVVVVGVFIACRLYNSIWSFVSIDELFGYSRERESKLKNILEKADRALS